jgi:hypothetical protein
MYEDDSTTAHEQGFDIFDDEEQIQTAYNNGGVV